MKILIVNTSDIVGGAARAAYRLHKSLLASGIDSQMLVQNKSSDDYTVLTETNKLDKYFNKLRPLLDSLPLLLYKHRTKIIFSTSWLGSMNMVNTINKIKPDIVHLHWICGGMLRIEDLVKIKAPIVWSLHDNWAFTGGCHIMWKCTFYKQSCGNCPILNSKKNNDLSRRVFKRKQKTFSKFKYLTVIGLSKWLNECSKNSALLKNINHITLPNPINTALYKPFDKNKARELFNLPTDKKIVMFGAYSATSDINKGALLLVEALQKITDGNIELVVFGSTTPKNPPNLGFKTHYLGHLHDDFSLITLYSSADVVIVPSLQEAFGQTASEAMSCGTPVVAFGHTGLLDIIDHKTNGYLAVPFDTTDLANGIEWILNAPNYDDICNNARKKVLSEFNSTLVARKYIKLYKEILTPGFRVGL